jgi:hypothetical protein
MASGDVSTLAYGKADVEQGSTFFGRAIFLLLDFGNIGF